MKSFKILIAFLILNTVSTPYNQATAQHNCHCVDRIASLAIDNEEGTLSDDELDQILLNECPSLYQLFESDETEGIQSLTTYLQACPKQTNQSLMHLEASGLLQFSNRDAGKVCYALDDLDRIINEMIAGVLSVSDAENQLSRHMNIFNKMESAEDIDGIYLMYSCPTTWQKFMKYADLLKQ